MDYIKHGKAYGSPSSCGSTVVGACDSEKAARRSVPTTNMAENGNRPPVSARYGDTANCKGKWRLLTLDDLTDLLNWGKDSLRNHYFNPMLEDGRIKARYRKFPPLLFRGTGRRLVQRSSVVITCHRGR